MDNLTHTAIGLFLARAGLRRLSPYATPMILIAANAPDVDIVSAAGGSLNYLHYHRHMTHALIAMPVMALVSAALVRVCVRKPIHWAGAFAAALIAVASHLALDWTNVYGIRMLLPFSGEWLRLDTTNVVDLWIWGVCALGVAGPFLARLVGSEIASGGARTRHHGRGAAWFVLLLVLLYDSARGIMQARAVTSLTSRLYEDAVPVHAIATPDSVNPMRWRGVVETDGAYVVQEVNLALPDPAAARPEVFHKPDPEPAIEAARRANTFQEFLRFSQFPLWRVTPWPAIENARLVEVFDMRFGTPVAPGFMASAVVDGRGTVVETRFHFGSPRPR
jgi:inner membrane protein